MTKNNETKITAEPGKYELVITREFDAPRELVFKAHTVYHEITAPERIISTFEFEGLPEKGHVILGTATFEALPGNRTKLISQAVFQSVADRDGMLQSGMERGASEGNDRLDEVLQQMKKENA